mgnify:FL=1
MVLTGALPQPFPVDINPEPRPVVGLTAAALSSRCKALGLIGWNAALMDVDGHSLLKGLDVRDKSRFCYRGSAHDVPSQSGSFTPSTISLF